MNTERCRDCKHFSFASDEWSSDAVDCDGFCSKEQELVEDIKMCPEDYADYLYDEQRERKLVLEEEKQTEKDT